LTVYKHRFENPKSRIISSLPAQVATADIKSLRMLVPADDACHSPVAWKVNWLSYFETYYSIRHSDIPNTSSHNCLC
jgi:hypothetical protein